MGSELVQEDIRSRCVRVLFAEFLDILRGNENARYWEALMDGLVRTPQEERRPSAPGALFAGILRRHR